MSTVSWTGPQLSQWALDSNVDGSLRIINDVAKLPFVNIIDTLPFSASPFLHWRFNQQFAEGGDGLTDLSGVNDVVLEGWDDLPPYGEYGYSFDGTNGLQQASSHSSFSANNVVFGCLIRRDQLLGLPGARRMFANIQSGFVRMRIDDGPINVIEGSVQIGSSVENVNSAGGLIEDLDWHYIYMSYSSDNGKGRLFLDGDLVGEETFDLLPTVGDADVMEIGRTNGGSNAYSTMGALFVTDDYSSSYESLMLAWKPKMFRKRIVTSPIQDAGYFTGVMDVSINFSPSCDVSGSAPLSGTDVSGENSASDSITRVEWSMRAGLDSDLSGIAWSEWLDAVNGVAIEPMEAISGRYWQIRLRLIPSSDKIASVSPEVGCVSVVHKRPNIVLFISDDHDSSKFGFMNDPVDAALKEQTSDGLGLTPNIDYLANTGVLFRKGYVPMSRCRASLASVITGQYPQEHGVYYNQTGVPKNQNPQRGLYKNDDENSDPIVNYPNMLTNLFKLQGYDTYGSGKWWEPENRSEEPLTYAFDGFKENPFIREEPIPQGDLFDWMAERHASDTRYFLWYAPKLPHAPYDAFPEFSADVDALDPFPVPSYIDLSATADSNGDGTATNYYGNVAVYDGDTLIQEGEHAKGLYANIVWLDYEFGRFLDRLEDNTIIFFYTDNGLDLGLVGKGSPYESGIASPMIVWGPKYFEGGQDISDFIHLIDFTATITEIIQESVPDTYTGTSILPLLKNEINSHRTTIEGSVWPVVYEVDIGNPFDTAYALWSRWDKYKYILYVRDIDDDEDTTNLWGLNHVFIPFPTRSKVTEELYDLESDSNELDDLSGQSSYESVLLFMRDLATDFWIEAGGYRGPDTPPKSRLSVDTSSPSLLAATYNPDYTTLNCGGYFDLLLQEHTTTQWNITGSETTPLSEAFPMMVKTSADGPYRSYNNVLSGNLTQLKVQLPLNRTKMKFRVRFKSEEDIWSSWSPYKSFTTRTKDYKRPGKDLT